MQAIETNKYWERNGGQYHLRVKYPTMLSEITIHTALHILINYIGEINDSPPFNSNILKLNFFQLHTTSWSVTPLVTCTKMHFWTFLCPLVSTININPALSPYWSPDGGYTELPIVVISNSPGHDTDSQFYDGIERGINWGCKVRKSSF